MPAGEGWGRGGIAWHARAGRPWPSRRYLLGRRCVQADKSYGTLLPCAVQVRDKQGAVEDLTSHGLAYKRKQLQVRGAVRVNGST